MGSLKKIGTPMEMINDGIVTPVRGGQPLDRRAGRQRSDHRQNEPRILPDDGTRLSSRTWGAMVTMHRDLRYKLWMH